MVFLITLKRNLSIFVKINTFGVIAVFGVIVFVCSFGFYSFTNTEFVISATENNNTPIHSGES